MKWIHRQKILPIHLRAKDSFTLHYTVTEKGSGDILFDQMLGDYPVDKRMVVDVIGVIELDDNELLELHLKDALVGVFGENDGELKADFMTLEDLPQEDKVRLKRRFAKLSQVIR